MKKYILALMMMPFGFTAMAQANFPFIAHNSQEFMHPRADANVKNVRADMQGMIVVKDKDGHEMKHDPSTVWGYRDEKGTEFRLFNGHRYQVMEEGSLSLYLRQTDEIVPNSEGDQAPVVKYYFSKRGTGNIYELNNKNIAMVFAPTNQKFVDMVKKENWNNDYSQYDRRSHKYKIEQLYAASMQ